jgi:hypothetical protein
MSIYSMANNGCVHRILVTLQVKDSQSKYEGFTRALCSIIPKMQWSSLVQVLYYLSTSNVFNNSTFSSNEETLALWNGRCETL